MDSPLEHGYHKQVQIRAKTDIFDLFINILVGRLTPLTTNDGEHGRHNVSGSIEEQMLRLRPAPLPLNNMAAYLLGTRATETYSIP